MEWFWTVLAIGLGALVLLLLGLLAMIARASEDYPQGPPPYGGSRTSGATSGQEGKHHHLGEVSEEELERLSKG